MQRKTSRKQMIGRANVGKSSLYNRFLVATGIPASHPTHSQLAIVGPDPGTTRDRKESLCSWGSLNLLLVDTPGIETDMDGAPSKSVEEICEQAAGALETYDVVLFVVDGKEGITPIDEMLAKQLLVVTKEKPKTQEHAKCPTEEHMATPSASSSRSPSIILVLNKTEGIRGAECIGEAYELQLGHPVAVSTRTKQGFDELYERVKEALEEREQLQRIPSVSLEHQNMRDVSHRNAAATEAWLQGLSRRYGRGVQPALAYNQALGGYLHLPWSLKKAQVDGAPSEEAEQLEETQGAGEKPRQNMLQRQETSGEQGDSGVMPLHDAGKQEPHDKFVASPEVESTWASQEKESEGPIRITFIGRPNAGKSSLINSILKENRLKASATPGTTTDSICINFCFKKQQMALIDTAGVTRGWKMRGDDMLQQASLQTMRNIRGSDVCILCLDAARIEETGNLSSHDLSLANLATEKEGRSLVVCVTKWDLVDLNKQSHVRRLVLDRLQTGLGHLKSCPVVFTSATQAQNLNTLLNKSCLVYSKWCSRVSTGTLNSWLQQYTAHWPPPWRLGSQCQVKYITQVQTKPPTFVAWSNVYSHFPTHYKRQLINAIREEFDMKGIPVRLVLRTTAMPKPGAKLTKAEALKWKRLGPHQYLAATKLSRKYVVKKGVR
ncbi:small GTP-binding protein, putative [Eimeria mitis]|uniref:GTPase Der n=1 Tax=Eimeria mitis TaxID=44415 RepID=U6JZ59_9EIME|nr:small GTP-binding protein, putative [Eimeria mitis]CDJ30775.1 small GTP-binding protein, putative [Eimeria mitis]